MFYVLERQFAHTAPLPGASAKIRLWKLEITGNFGNFLFILVNKIPARHIVFLCAMSNNIMRVCAADVMMSRRAEDREKRGMPLCDVTL